MDYGKKAIQARANASSTQDWEKCHLSVDQGAMLAEDGEHGLSDLDKGKLLIYMASPRGFEPLLPP